MIFNRKTKYPIYTKTNNCLYAFVAHDKMYKIEMIGSNKNPGCTVDHYITRNMVLKHSKHVGDIISEKQFIELYNNLFGSILNKITNHAKI